MKQFLLFTFSFLIALCILSLPIQARYNYEWEMGSDALGLTQLNSPLSMTTDAEGNIYMIDNYNYRIQK